MRLVRRLAKNDTLAEEGEERSNKKRAYGKRKRKAGWKAARWEEREKKRENGKGYERRLVHRCSHRHTRAWLLILSLRVLFSSERGRGRERERERERVYVWYGEEETMLP